MSNKYLSLIIKSNNWALKECRGLFFSSLFKGIVSIGAIYASLASLGLLINNIQTQQPLFDQNMDPSNQQFILLFFVFIFSSLIGSFFQYSFYRESFKIWAQHSTFKSKFFLDSIKALPNKKYKSLNRFYIDKEEMMLNSGGRARAIGAFGHYSRISFLELLKITTFLIILTVMAPKFTVLVFLCFIILSPWILSSYKKSSQLSLKIESQQKLSGKERILNFGERNNETELLFNLIAKNYQQSKANSLFTSIATTISIALVFGFAYFQGAQTQQIGYWVMIFIMSRLLTSSLMTFSSTLVLMSRQASPAMLLESACNGFVDHKSIPATTYGKDINNSNSNLYWINHKKINPSIDELNSILFLYDLFADNEHHSVVINNKKIDNIYQKLMHNLSDDNVLAHELKPCIDYFELRHLKSLNKDLKIKGENKIKATLIQYIFAKSVLNKKRIFISNSFLWAFDLKNFKSFFNKFESQVFVYYSSNTDSKIPIQDNFRYIHFDIVQKVPVITNSPETIDTMVNSYKMNDLHYVDG